jgi:glycosyltransferase involved in cell wall biosynthesis
MSCQQVSQQTKIEIVQIFRNSILKYVDPRSISGLFKALKENDIHTCIVNHPFFFIPTFFVCKMTRRKIITYSHNLEHRRTDGLKYYGRLLIFVLEFIAYRLSDSVFFISSSELIDAHRLFRLDLKRCYFVPHIARRHDQNIMPNQKRNSTFTVTFFGDFSYGPNQLGLRHLVQNVAPLLADRAGFPCKLQIFGKNCPENLARLSSINDLSIEILDYIERPSELIRGADVMITPVNTGTGVQTKIIEALSLGTTVISARSGTRGIDKDACGEKLLIVEDEHWDSYIDKLLEVRTTNAHLLPTPESFFNVYSEESVMSTVLSAINDLR